ncbi:MAG: MFS transporter [Bacteroidales bacterium]|jgi:FSR family fosmidomycin resistance protein-like MFS transporter
MHSPNKFRSADVILLSLAHHIHDIYTSFLAPVQTLLIEKFAINHTLFGLLSVIQRVPNLLNPFVGILADRMRLRFLVIFAPAVTAISMSLIGVAPGYAFLAILMLVSGISSSMFHVPTPVMIKHIAGNRTGRGMSFYMVGGELARTIGPLIVVGAVEIWGFEGIFRLIPMGLVASVILYVRFRHLDIRKDFAEQQKAGDYKASLRSFLPLLIIIVSITFTRGFMKSCLTYYLPGFMEETGHSRWIAGISLSVVYLSGTAGTFLSGTISDYIGRKNTLLIFAVVSPLLMWLFIAAGQRFIFPVLVLTGFFLLAPTPVILAIIHEQKTRHLPFINGLYMTSNFLISSLSTLITGYFLDKLGNETTFRISALIAILTIPVVLLYREK